MGTQSLITARLAQLGSQRDWVWRGWQIRYTYIRPALDSTGKQTGLPVICLHGFGSALGQWRSNLKSLGEGHHIYALDFLGFGASEKAPARYSVWLWADLVYDFWRTFIGKPAVVVGHSLGALIGLTAVANHPEMACGLALLTLPDAQPKQPPAWARSVERMFANPLLLLPLFKIVRQPWLLRRVLQKIYIRPELVDDELVALFATPPQDRGALAVFCRLSQSRSDDNYSPTVKDLLPCVRTPILLIWGREDMVVPVAGAGQLKLLNPNVRLVEIENAGHCAFDECPEKVNQEIIDWIDKEVRASVSPAAG
ncbi:MAG: alpha/beta fold hydrolase [Oscillatoria princeps RMCB-10]|nr:alpha/beta fold hydrolase [Oscillatoria princeps RMCB-10]